MSSFTSSTTSAIPAVTATTSRLIGILERVAIPVAAVSAGFIGGRPLAFEIGEFLTVFVPGIQTMDNWIFHGSKSGTVTVSISLAVTGVVLMTAAVLADQLISRFLGLGRLTMMLRRGVVAFLFGAGARALTESFAPLKGAVEAFSETSLPDGGNGGGGGTLPPSPFDNKIIPSPTPTPAPLPSPIDGDRRKQELTPIPGGNGERERFIIVNGGLKKLDGTGPGGCAYL